MGSSGQFEHLTRQVDDPLCPRRILVRLLALDPLDPHGHVEYPDAVAAAYLLNPGIFTSEKLALFVETEGSCQGQSLSVPGGKWYENPQEHAHFKADKTITPVNVLLKLDVEGYLRLIEESLV